MKDRKFRITVIDRTGAGEETERVETFASLPRYLTRMEELMRDGAGYERHTAERTNSKVYHLPQTSDLFN